MQVVQSEHCQFVTQTSTQQWYSSQCTSTVLVEVSFVQQDQSKKRSTLIHVSIHTKLYTTGLHIPFYTAHATTPTIEYDNTTDPTIEDPTVQIDQNQINQSTSHQCGGALEMHRTISWTIVVAVLSIAALCILDL